MRKRFRINRTDNKNGPSIFGYRLKKQLEAFGWEYSKGDIDYNICFSVGDYIQNAINVLRLDGLYFDTGNVVGDTDALNAPIKKAYHKFDKIIFQGNFCKEMYFRHFGVIDKPYTIIPNGVPPEFSPEGDKIFTKVWKKTLICSSRWRAHKRLGAIVAGFNYLNDKDVRLLILGGGSGVYDIPNIIAVGRVTPESLPFYLRGADAFVHLSFLDWAPNVVSESLACGLPVLCSHNGGTKEIVGDSGIVCTLEEDYDYKRLDLYNPPVPNPEIVAQGMREILKWDKPVVRPDLSIKHVAKRYMQFIEVT
jgi:glycosyltransferase involved in cell wall biosynthesis